MGKINCFLSKCRYLNGVKCLKLAWYECNDPKRIPKPDAVTQATFNWGHFIGEKAKAYFPEGEENLEQDFNTHIRRSMELLTKGIPLFEVAYMSDNLYARPDIIRPNGDGTWDIIEVKCNTSVHEVNIRDVAYQRFVLTHAGLNIRDCILMHPKPEIKVGRDTDPAEIFVLEKVTERVLAYLPGIAENVRGIRTNCAQDAPPDIEVGEHCEKPYRCPMFDLCFQADLSGVKEMLAQEKIAEADRVDELITLAMELAVDACDSLALDALHKAMSLSKYSSDLCNIAIALHELELSEDSRGRCLKIAYEKAKLPADFDEIARTEKQIQEVRYADEI